MVELMIGALFLIALASPAIGMGMGKMSRMRLALKSYRETALGANGEVLGFSSSKGYEKGIATFRNDISSRYGEELSALRTRAEANSGYPVYGYIQGLLEKFSYLQTIERPHQIRVAAELRYVAILEKLNQLLAPEYYGDFLENPSHWDNPELKIDQVERALRSLSANLDADIRSANSFRSDEFEVAAQVLLGADNPERPESLEGFSLLEEIQDYALGLESLLTTSKQEFLAIEAATKEELQALDGAPLDRRTIVYSKHSNGFLYTIWADSLSEKASTPSHALQVKDLIQNRTKWEPFTSLHWAASRVDGLIASEAEKHGDAHRCAYCAFDFSPET